MTRIVVTAEQLRSLGSQLQQTADGLWEIRRRIGDALADLDWEARQKAGVDGQVNAARNRAHTLADQASAMSRYLLGKADAFDEADRKGVDHISRLSIATGGALSASALGGGLAPIVPMAQIESQLRLGTLLDNALQPAAATLAAASVALPASLKQAQPAFRTAGRVVDYLGPTRTFVRTDLAKVGRLVNGLVGNKHGGYVTKMQGLTKIVPVRDARKLKLPAGVAGAGIGAGLEFLAGGDYTAKGAAVAGITTGAVVGLTYLVPGVGTVLMVSAGVQLLGSLALWGLHAAEGKEWSDKARKGLDKVLEVCDLHGHIRNASEYVVDKAVTVWEQPPAQQIRDLGSFAISA